MCYEDEVQTGPRPIALTDEELRMVWHALDAMISDLRDESDRIEEADGDGGAQRSVAGDYYQLLQKVRRHESN